MQFSITDIWSKDAESGPELENLAQQMVTLLKPSDLSTFANIIVRLQRQAPYDPKMRRLQRDALRRLFKVNLHALSLWRQMADVLNPEPGAMHNRFYLPTFPDLQPTEVTDPTIKAGINDAKLKLEEKKEQVHEAQSPANEDVDMTDAGYEGDIENSQSLMEADSQSNFPAGNEDNQKQEIPQEQQPPSQKSNKHITPYTMEQAKMDEILLDETMKALDSTQYLKERFVRRAYMEHGINPDTGLMTTQERPPPAEPERHGFVAWLRYRGQRYPTAGPFFHESKEIASRVRRPFWEVHNEIFRQWNCESGTLGQWYKENRLRILGVDPQLP